MRVKRLKRGRGVPDQPECDLSNIAIRPRGCTRPLQSTSCSVPGTSWATGLEFVGNDERLVAHAGALPPRLLAGRLGLTGGLSARMRRRGFEPAYDRGQVLLDLALTLIDGDQRLPALAHLAPVIGPVPSTSTVWRVLNETGGLQLARVNAAVTEFRRRWWGLLADRPVHWPRKRWLHLRVPRG
jgi:hypothetical protein